MTAVATIKTLRGDPLDQLGEIPSMTRSNCRDDFMASKTLQTSASCQVKRVQLAPALLPPQTARKPSLIAAAAAVLSRQRPTQGPA